VTGEVLLFLPSRPAPCHRRCDLLFRRCGQWPVECGYGCGRWKAEPSGLGQALDQLSQKHLIMGRLIQLLALPNFQEVALIGLVRFLGKRCKARCAVPLLMPVSAFI